MDLGSAADAAAATLGNNDTFHNKLSRQRLLAARRGGLARAPRDRSVGRRTCSVGSAEDTAVSSANAASIAAFTWAVAAAVALVAAAVAAAAGGGTKQLRWRWSRTPEAFKSAVVPQRGQVHLEN